MSVKLNVPLPINTFVEYARPTIGKGHRHIGGAFGTRGDVDAHADIALLVID